MAKIANKTEFENSTFTSIGGANKVVQIEGDDIIDFVKADIVSTDIPFTPTGTISATNMQAAIAEVASEASGTSNVTYITMSGDFTNSTTTLTAITGLTFTPEQNSTYELIASLCATVGSTTIGQRFSASWTAANFTRFTGSIETPISSNAKAFRFLNSVSGSITTTNTSSNTIYEGYSEVKLIFKTNSNTQTPINIIGAPHTTGTLTVYSNSFIKVTKIA